MKIFLLAAAAGAAWGQAPDIDEVMRRVALNQAKSLELRTNYVYHQRQLLRMIRGTKKIAREEIREYTITPKFRGNDRQLVHFEGKYEKGGKYISFDQPGHKHKELDLDGELLKELADDMMNHKNGKDGIANDLFPLTYRRQQMYNFKFVKTENFKGAKAYRIRFEPKEKASLKNLEDGAIWKGEALIDAAEYQPIQVATQMAWKMPLAIRTLLGTNLHGVGFTVNYQKFEEGLWFPVTYGGEFELRAVFLYHRHMTINMTNSDFRRTNVQSQIAYSTDEDK